MSIIIDLPRISSIIFETESSAVFKWLASLYEAFKPLTTYYLEGAIEPAIIIWIRNSINTAVPVEVVGQLGGHVDGKNSYHSTEDSVELGWWVCSVDLRCFGEEHQPQVLEVINFYSSDFRNIQKVKDNFEKIINHLINHSGTQSFSIEEVRQTPSALAEKTKRIKNRLQ